jgi:D-tyrosyl-tRNA(Tyr) deacylase
MKAVVQRVSEASVTVDNTIVGQIGRGFLVLLGVGMADDERTAALLARKIAGLRLFADADGKMNLSLAELNHAAGEGAVLAVSQFTLYADVRKGRRPSFVHAAPPDVANRLYQSFCAALTAEGIRVERGIFQAEMQVALINDGPVTILIDSDDLASNSSS